jgi:hypothetical protein
MAVHSGTHAPPHGQSLQRLAPCFQTLSAHDVGDARTTYRRSLAPAVPEADDGDILVATAWNQKGSEDGGKYETLELAS